MIEFEGVVKEIAGRRIVDGVSFRVAAGELCALVGSSGAGKTTALKMVNRLVPMSAGTIRVGGEDVMRMDPRALRRRIGYVIQGAGLFPHRTVAENIATVPRLLGWERDRIEARIEQLMAMLRLPRARYGDAYPHELSGGQQQRVGFARALAADPALMLMDEPFGALDPIIRDELADELAAIQRDTGKTILMVTHDLDLALRHASRIAIMHEGRIEQAAGPAEILERPASDFVRAFVGGEGRGMKLLQVRRVAERARPGGTAEGAPVAATASLAEALSEMVAQRTDRLPVRDEAGTVTGAIALGDLVR
jgi:osmoprotectant transport system ATP-binding protein